jgi:hypothetical protein
MLNKFFSLGCQVFCETKVVYKEIKKSKTRFELSMVINIQVMVFWDVTPCSVVEAGRCFKILVSYHITTWHCSPEDDNLKR